jgi:hypothetical protein
VEIFLAIEVFTFFHVLLPFPKSTFYFRAFRRQHQRDVCETRNASDSKVLATLRGKEKSYGGGGGSGRRLFGTGGGGERKRLKTYERAGLTVTASDAFKCQLSLHIIPQIYLVIQTWFCSNWKAFAYNTY